MMNRTSHGQKPNNKEFEKEGGKWEKSVLSTKCGVVKSHMMKVAVEQEYIDFN